MAKARTSKRGLETPEIRSTRVQPGLSKTHKMILSTHEELVRKECEASRNRFAATVIGPLILRGANRTKNTPELMKRLATALQNVNGTQKRLDRFRSAAQPLDQPGGLVFNPGCWNRQSVGGPVEDFGNGPAGKVEVHVDPDSWLGPNYDVVYADANHTAGILSLGAAVGSLYGTKKGEDWFFGDYNLAQASIVNFVNFPPVNRPRHATVAIDVQVGWGLDPNWNGCSFIAASEQAWLGALGRLFLDVYVVARGGGHGVTGLEFLRAWAIPDSVSTPATGGRWVPSFRLLSDSVYVPNNAVQLAIVTSGWVEALRLLVGDPDNFYDNAGVDFSGGAPMYLREAGPIKITGMSVNVCPAF